MIKVIALVDCDSFFVSCEQKARPEFKNRSVCVLTSVNNKGVVVSRSKEAKALGIKMGAPYFQIKEMANQVIFLPARHDWYDKVSSDVMRVVKTFSPDVEVVSVDEAFIDLTGLNKFYNKSYTDIIKDIRSKVLAEVDIPVSIGLSTSKTLAKLASDKAKKTGGIFVIRPDKISETISDIPMQEVSGVGKSTAETLAYENINTIGDFLKKDMLWIKKELGLVGERLKYELMGQAINLVNPKEEKPQSIQDTKTFDDFSNDVQFLHSRVGMHVHNTSQKLRALGGYCATIGVMLRTKTFQTYEKEIRLSMPTNSERTLAKQAHSLVDLLYKRGLFYRSIGVTLKHLQFGETPQLTLFDSPKVEDDKISHLIDELETKFGKNVIKLG